VNFTRFDCLEKKFLIIKKKTHIMSLFNLPMAPPSPDHGVSSMYMQKVEPNQPVQAGAAFGSQTLQFQINPAVNEWFIPNRSYFRIRYRLNAIAGDGIARIGIGSVVEAATGDPDKTKLATYPAYGLCSRLFNSCRFYVGSTAVCSITSNLPQVDSVHKRTTLSRTQLESSDGLYQASAVDRKGQLLGCPAAVATDGSENKTAITFETIWSPPMGISDISHGLPASMYRWEFNCNPDFVTDVVDGNNVQKLVPGTDYEFAVESMVLYACYARGPSSEDTKWALNMKSIQVQALQMAKNSASLQLKNFDTPTDTSALALAFQGTTENLSKQNKFGGPGLFKIDDLKQNLLKRWYISYDNSIYPQEQNEDLYGGTNALISQRYRDTMTQTGMYYSPGGAETLNQWLRQTGAYYLINWPRVQGTATRVQVNAQLNSGTATDFQVLLISVSDQTYLIRTEDGKVRKVEVGE
jgi:hypothetical protein